MAKRFFSSCFSLGVFGVCFLTILFLVPSATAQIGSQGGITVLVVDQSGGIIQGAKLELQDRATNAVRNSETLEGGSATFSEVPFGTYKLTVAKDGFQTEILSAVVVQGGRITDVKVVLKVGATTESVVVDTSATPLVELTSSTIATTIDLKQVEDLPLQGRDVSTLAQLSPGYSGSGGFGTWNGLPVIAQANTIDGVVSSTSRMKFGGNVQPGLEARLEDIQEMTVESEQVDLSHGMGIASMQVNFVTRRGSNDYHGRVYEDFRNTVLNANSWTNNAEGQPRNPLILNDFGGSAGGHIIKDKLFFFGSFSMSKQPGGFIANQQVLSPLAQQGIFTYTQGPKQGQTVNLLTQIAQPNGLPVCGTSPDPCAAFTTEQGHINDAVGSPGAIVTPLADPNLQNVSWLVHSPVTHYYPAFRLDYNFSQKLRFDFSFEETKINQPGAAAPPFPGDFFGNQSAENRSNNYIGSLGISWTVTPTLVNQFRAGYYYNAYWYDSGPTPSWTTLPQINWGLGNSGQFFNLPTNTYYPVVNVSDSADWQRGRHTIKFGFDFYREQDHYWNPPDGIDSVNLGLVNGDPAFTAFENFFGASDDKGEAENLYGELVGRISGIGPVGSGFAYDQQKQQYLTGQHGPTYNLDELQKGWGLYAQDSFRITPRLTFNYGLRWDFTGDDHDLTAAYHGAGPVEIFGPSGVGNLFQPGTLTGNSNPAYVASSHQYKPWNVTPQPTIGLAWNPNYSEGFLGRLFGGSNSVIRAGFDVKRFTEPYQYFWNSATNHGLAYFQGFTLQPGSGTGAGVFAPGSLNLPAGADDAGLDSLLANNSLSYLLTPPAYANSLPESLFTFVRPYWGASGFDPHIQEPYVMEWNLGVQRQIGNSNVLEVRYMGHRSVHQWIATDPNEVNIFENGFLKQFQAAQANLQACMANAGCAANPSFQNKGLPGQVALPIFDAAFACPPSFSGCSPGADYTNGGFINDLQQGAAGALADQLAYPFGTVPYICNLAGSSLTPCQSSQFGGFTAPGAFPLNFFQVNPYADGNIFGQGDPTANTGYMSAQGYGNYHALQVDFRQKAWHGMQFDVNYTWSHTLGLQPDGQWTGSVNVFTIRDLRDSYGPTTFDLRNVVHASGTFDLPFGHGKALLANTNGVVDKIVGGWTLGTIFTFESGFPFQLLGGYHTFTDTGDGGLVLNGVTVSQLQNAIGVFNPTTSQCAAGQPCTFKDTINPALLGTGSGNCNTFLAKVCQNTTPGTLGFNPWLYGPHLWNDDMSLSKLVPIGERFRFAFQVEALNIFNHPNWANPGLNISQSNFGTSGLSNFNGPRILELRANISF
ncbi:MAG TPA: TonB-dependent receptor [Candidatus Bathyarchaeia archaeon]|nr:TonB-dependent receptor [Candidatus Bathyarchaeia archaeon]